MTFLIGGMFIYEGCSEDLCIFSFLSLLETLSLVHWSCDHLVIANIIFIFDIYIYLMMMMMMMMMMLSIHLSLHVFFPLSLYTHVSYYCMQSFIFVSHLDAMMSFV